MNYLQTNYKKEGINNDKTSEARLTVSLMFLPPWGSSLGRLLSTPYICLISFLLVNGVLSYYMEHLIMIFILISIFLQLSTLSLSYADA